MVVEEQKNSIPALPEEAIDEAKSRAEKAIAQFDLNDPVQAQFLYAAATGLTAPNAATTHSDAPLYVNAKQYNRIIKRRASRAKFEAKVAKANNSAGGVGDSPASLLTSSPGMKRPYMHESRHKHAMRRPRGPGGRFLTAKEIAELKAQQSKQEQSSGGDKGNNDNQQQQELKAAH